MWKLNGNFHLGCGGLKVVLFGNKDGSTEKPVMIDVLDAICYSEFVVLEDGGKLYHSDSEPMWHVYWED